MLGCMKSSFHSVTCCCCCCRSRVAEGVAVVAAAAALEEEEADDGVAACAVGATEAALTGVTNGDEVEEVLTAVELLLGVLAVELAVVAAVTLLNPPKATAANRSVAGEERANMLLLLEVALVRCFNFCEVAVVAAATVSAARVRI